MRKAHAELNDESLLSSLARTCEQQISPTASAQCPFCKEQVVSRQKIKSHIGRHQMDLSLRALPVSANNSCVPDAEDHEIEARSMDSQQSCVEQPDGQEVTVELPSSLYEEQHTKAEDAGPDILLLKHRGVKYTLHFPSYIIDDGILTVRDLRQRAAERTGTSNPNHIKLIYKRKLLRDDSRSYKEEGLKMQSEVLCIVWEGQQGERTPTDLSDSDMDGQPSLIPRSLTPAPDRQDFRTPREQLDSLVSYFRQELLPLCDAFVANPPADFKSREFEHRKLSETVLVQILLKTDGIDIYGDQDLQDLRNDRKAFLLEVQRTLTRLDQAGRVPKQE